jgi:GNAT superfamily N-acetyltransferase
VSEIVVRTASPGEEARLAQLAETAIRPDVVPAQGEAVSSRLGSELRADAVFVAECDGRTAGDAAVAERGDTLVLDQLVVAATDRGRHVGHALLDWAEGYGVSRGLRRVRVELVGADQRAREFYARRGYLEGEDALERELTHT